MKKIYSFLLIVISITLNASAQTITGFTVVPPNPTSADTVKIYVQCDFPDKDCEGTTYLNGINGNVIDAGGLHCMGSLTGPCTDIDTVIVPPLAAGQYSLVFVLVTGITVGCIPNIVPVVVDSTQFTVSPVTGIYDVNGNKPLEIMPNPSSGKLIVKQNTGEKSLLQLFSAEGRLVKSFLLTNKETEIICDFPSGIYTVMTESKDSRFFSKLIVVK